jgi:7-cyano-7-deazaguanine synthase
LRDLVLCSGGIDSTTLAAHLSGAGERPELCFVNYGQPAVGSELRSVHAVAKNLGLSVVYTQVGGLEIANEGEIIGRNLLLLTIALALRPGTRSIGLGIHAGTGYRDCSPDFVDLAQTVLDFHRNGESRLVAPFVDWSKADILALARELDAPIDLTHSCETGDEPCGNCRSCIDREVLLAR